VLIWWALFCAGVIDWPYRVAWWRAVVGNLGEGRAQRE
jgi:hypothetical protein